MIHYHGGPITPESVAEKVWRARHAFISFKYPNQLSLASSICQSFALDNAAWSYYKEKTIIKSWDPFYVWIEDWKDHPGFDFTMIPDKIDGNEKQNKRLIDEWPFGLIGVPVWHLHESIRHLKRLASNWPRIAFGSSGEFAQIGTKKWWLRMYEAVSSICNEKGRPVCKLHGLRMMNSNIFTKFPFSSVDSTNIAINIGLDKNWSSYGPKTKETRGLVLAERIEWHNSAGSLPEKLKDFKVKKRSFNL